MPRVLRVGDKFVNLVHNETNNHEIGDILTIKWFGSTGDRILITKDNLPDSDWWFSIHTMKEFLVPYDEVDEKSLFTTVMTGQYPGKRTLRFTKEILKKIYGMSAEQAFAEIDHKCCLYFYMRTPHDSI